MEVATVFLETSLGTRLAVSFPASATTIADLKRRVSDEHAAAFPHIGHIAVQAIKVSRSGALYHLTDSMAIRDAFHGVTGAWHLQVDALPRPALHVAQGRMAQAPQVPHGCNCKHSPANHSEPVAACHQHEGEEGSSSRSFALGCRKRSVCEMLTDQAELGATHAERAPREKHRAIKRRDTVPAADVGFLCVHKESCSIDEVHINATSNKEAHLAPSVEELKEGDPSEKEVEEKETWTAKVCNRGTDLPPPCAAEPTKEDDSSEKEAMTRQVEEPLTAKVCNGDGSSQGTDLPPPCAVEPMKEVDSSENEAMEHKVEEKETRTTRVCNGERSINGTDLPQSTKECDSYGKEAMPHKVEEKEPWTARVSNGERSSQGTDLPPPCVAKCTKEGGSSEKEAMQHKAEEKETCTARMCNGEGGNKETDLPPPYVTESTKEGDSSEEEAMQHKVEEKVCNRESSSNWTDLPPWDKSMNEDDSSENEVMQHEVQEKEPWTARACKGGGSSHWNDPIEWTDAEQRAWEMALEKRRRPRIAVRKMPNSRAARLYGYR